MERKKERKEGREGRKEGGREEEKRKVVSENSGRSSRSLIQV